MIYVTLTEALLAKILQINLVATFLPAWNWRRAKATQKNMLQQKPRYDRQIISGVIHTVLSTLVYVIRPL